MQPATRRRTSATAASPSLRSSAHRILLCSLRAPPCRVRRTLLLLLDCDRCFVMLRCRPPLRCRLLCAARRLRPRRFSRWIPLRSRKLLLPSLT